MKHKNDLQQEALMLVPQSFLDGISEKQSQILELLNKDNSSQNPIGDYISEAEAQKLLGRKTTWFWNMRTTGKLAYTKVGNKIFYSKEDIIKLLDTNKQSFN
jgi:hypothetical protein